VLCPDTRWAQAAGAGGPAAPGHCGQAGGHRGVATSAAWF